MRHKKSPSHKLGLFCRHITLHTSMEIISQALGSTQSYTVSLFDASGSPVTTFTGTEVLAASCWGGDGQSVLATPTVAWLTAPAGTLTLTVSAANTAALLTTGQYRLQVTIPATSQVLWDGVLDLTDGPGTATPGKVYCGYQDMLDLWPEVGQFEGYHGATQYLYQRVKARKWLENVLQRHYRWTGYMGLESFGYPTALNPSWGSDGDSPVLKQWLDADRLIVNDATVELCASFALGLALQTAVGVDDRATQYQQMGAYYMQRAVQGVKGYVGQLDLTAAVPAATPTLAISCSVTSARF